MKNRVTVLIAKQEYTLGAAEELSYLQKIASHVDAKIQEVLDASKVSIVDGAVLAAVNIAVTLEKPLLIKGEPGTGKTMLAQAVSQALGKELIIWNVKSTTKAQDGLYVYDVVQRLYDSQFGTHGVDDVSWGRRSPPKSRWCC